ncbi:alpha/beta hydrolase [Saccharopolyspora karakumensis]|uniref:alpha/beta hydrolase n=1 Tax=Saccharopolyspora karakumensis TaxID=2530386 RepID=UPI001F41F933|nr:alpha/beta hydrolase [Saccharopolyspora karakumensis]
MKRRRAAVLSAMVGLTCSVVTPMAVADEGLAWGPCPADVKTETVVLECATIPVPLDHADPGGERIELMVSRLASTNPAKRRGVLMLNPGGPGGSGLAFPDFVASRGMPADVLESYDLIGMDTRGIGHSAPVSCGFTSDQGYLGNIPPYAVDDAAFVAQAESAKRVAEQCAAHDADGRMRHLSTANVARDLDRIRAALGEEKASFLGYSYESALGAVRVDVPRAVRPDRGRQQHRRHPSRPRRSAQVRARFRGDLPGLRELGGRAARDLRPGAHARGGARDVLPARRTAGRGAGQRHRRARVPAGHPRRPVREDEVRAHRAGVAVGEHRGETPEPTASEAAPTDNPWSVFLAVTCNDFDWSGDVRTYQRAVAEDRERYPMYGAASANISPCASWEAPAEPPVAIDRNGPENVLVLQNRRDPVTPHRGGEILDEKFGDRSRLVSVEGSGHGVYVLGENACALNTTTDFLVDGELPERDTVCR